MAYCSDCGVYYTSETNICPSCGNHVSQNRKPDHGPVSDIGSKVPVSTELIDNPSESNAEGNAEFNKGIENSSQSSPNNLDHKQDGMINDKISPEPGKAEPGGFDYESQLGKGIIKPQKVEMAVDGVHFKYETPPHSFKKEGPVKERPKEYRTTGNDMGLKSPDEMSLKNTFLEEHILSQIVDQEKVESVVDQEESPRESERQATLESVEESGEQIPVESVKAEVPPDEREEVTEEPVIKELISEPEIPEPELSEDYGHRLDGDNVIWEGAQSWYKIPIGNYYKITGRKLMIFDKNQHKLLDVSLSWIAEITVKQSWVGKLIGIGDLMISIPDFAASKIVLGGISEPFKVKNVIEERKKYL